MQRMKIKPVRPRGMKALAATLTLSGLLATGAVMVPGGAGASTSSTRSSSTSGSSPAVVAPLLKFFEFGNSIGLPLACSDAGSVVSIIGAQSGQASVTSPLVTQLNGQCAALSAKGGSYLQQAITESQGLALINPVVNPLLVSLSTAFSTVGVQYGPSLAPFGPTVAGLGGTVVFFEGS